LHDRHFSAASSFQIGVVRCRLRSWRTRTRSSGGAIDLAIAIDALLFRAKSTAFSPVIYFTNARDV
jgi:hypothetical protein